MPQRIIVFTEQYQERYFEANTAEQINRAFLKIIRERYNSGEYNTFRLTNLPVPPQTLELANIPDEIVEQLPAGIQYDVANARKRVAVAQEMFDKEKRWWDAMERLVAMPDEEALVALSDEPLVEKEGKVIGRSLIQAVYADRINNDYEGYEIITLEEI